MDNPPHDPPAESLPPVEADLTLAQAAAWIAYRSNTAVQLISPKNTAPDPSNGRGGLLLFRWYACIGLFDDEPTTLKHPLGACEELTRALKAGQLEAIAQRCDDNSVVQIPRPEWHYLRDSEIFKDALTLAPAEVWAGTPVYRGVIVEREAVLRLWPEQQPADEIPDDGPAEGSKLPTIPKKALSDWYAELMKHGGNGSEAEDWRRAKIRFPGHSVPRALMRHVRNKYPENVGPGRRAKTPSNSPENSPVSNPPGDGEFLLSPDLPYIGLNNTNEAESSHDGKHSRDDDPADFDDGRGLRAVRHRS